MEQKDLAELSDEALLARAKKMKSRAITQALFIGFLIGIIIFSILKSRLGLFTLIPLYLLYRLLDKSKENKALKKVLKERNLK